MADRFGREYELLIGRAATLTSQVIPQNEQGRRIERGSNNSETPTNTDFNSLPPGFQRIVGLQIRASIGQTKDQSPSNEIILTNASEAQIASIRADDTLILRAGYRQRASSSIQADEGDNQRQQPDIFVGQIIRIVTEHIGRNKETKILCGEAITVKKNSKISKSYTPGTTRLEVIEDLVSLVRTQGVPTGSIRVPEEGTEELATVSAPLLTGYTAKGNLFNEIERICLSSGMRSYTALGRVYVEPARRASVASAGTVEGVQQTSRILVTVTPESIKGTVEPLSDNTVGLSNANGSDGEQGIKLTTFLDGRISVNMVLRMVDFPQQRFNGDFEITSIVHELDFEGSAWDTKISGRKL